MKVIKASIVVKVGTVLVPGTEAVIGPAVWLPWSPPPVDTQPAACQDATGAVAERAADAHLRFMMYGVWLTHSHIPVLPSVSPTQ